MNLIKAIRHPQKTFEKISYRLLCIIGHLDFKRFIVLSRSRTGSNMLISFLNSHPNIHAEGEIFSKLNGQDYKDVLAKAFSKQPSYIAAKGFKIFYYHPLDDEPDSLWKDLMTLDDLRVIHLKRRNIFRTLISRKLAGMQDVWRIPSSESLNPVKNRAVTFTPEELEEGFKQTKEWEGERRR